MARATRNGIIGAISTLRQEDSALRAWAILLACLLTIAAVVAGALVGHGHDPAGAVGAVTPGDRAGSGSEGTGNGAETGGLPSELQAAEPATGETSGTAGWEGNAARPFTGIPKANAELDKWLVEHPAADPRIVVTISDGPRAEAIVHLYDGDEMVGALFGFGGPPDNPTIVGDYKVALRLGTIHTGLYKADLGHEFWLRDFIQIKGNYGFHAYKVNDATNEEEPGSTHGCIALPAGDEAALFQWVKVGTPVSIHYVNADTANVSAAVQLRTTPA